MSEYPVERELCGIYYRVERDGRRGNVCYSDMTPEERKAVVADRMAGRPMEEQAAYWHRMADVLADRLHELGDELDVRREY